MNKKLKDANLKRKVERIIEGAEKYLSMHGGSVRLLEIDQDNVAKVEFNGACVGCSAAETTLNFLLKESILVQCPEITDVEAINLVKPNHAPPGIRI